MDERNGPVERLDRLLLLVARRPCLLRPGSHLLCVGRMTHHDSVRRFSAHLFFVTIYLRQHLIVCKEARL
jgi:hypothetical protein